MKIVENITTHVKCWKIILSSNETIGVTENITDITYDGILYKSNSNQKLALDSYTFLNIEQILPSDVALGKLDGALIKIFFFDYNKNIEVFEVNSGILSKVTIIDGKFFFNIIPTIKTLNGLACNYYSRTCRANFCDKKCGIDINNFTYEGEIMHLDGNKIFSKIFSDFENGYFSGATLELGNNKYKIDSHNNDYAYIKCFNQNKTTNHLKFKIFLDCDKEFTTCSNKYNNALNFQGEPALKDSF